MGCYIETNNETKIEFCKRTGEKVTLEYIIKNLLDLKNESRYPVAIIYHTGNIVSAPIIYDKQELSRLLKEYGTKNHNDYYVINLNDLMTVSNIDKFI